jgi:hypothetical protein
MLSEQEKQQFQQQFDNPNNGPESRNYAADMLLRHHLLDTAGANLTVVRNILSQRGDLYSRFRIVDTRLQEGNASAAQQALSAIPSQIQLEGEYQAEYNQFEALKSLQINALQSGLDDEALVAGNPATLAQIAEAGPYYAAAQAQALLNSETGFSYTPRVTLPSIGQMGLVAPPPGNVASQSAETIVEALPNPARSQVEFRYRLPENIENGRITVTDLNGRTVAGFEVKGGSGSLIWEFREIREGVYIYSLIAGNLKPATKRLVIVR